MPAELFVVRQLEGNKPRRVWKAWSTLETSSKLLRICIGLVVSEVTIKPWNDLAQSVLSTVVLLDWG